MTIENKIEEILQIVVSERTVNNARFSQLGGRLDSLDDKMALVTKDVGDLRLELNNVHRSLSEDIQAFAQDVVKFGHRMDKVEKKIA